MILTYNSLYTNKLKTKNVWIYVFKTLLTLALLFKKPTLFYPFVYGFSK